jgi:hypothetical protein
MREIIIKNKKLDAYALLANKFCIWFAKSNERLFNKLVNYFGLKVKIS